MHKIPSHNNIFFFIKHQDMKEKKCITLTGIPLVTAGRPSAKGGTATTDGRTPRGDAGTFESGCGKEEKAVAMAGAGAEVVAGVATRTVARAAEREVTVCIKVWTLASKAARRVRRSVFSLVKVAFCCVSVV